MTPGIAVITGALYLFEQAYNSTAAEALRYTHILPN